MPRFPTSAPIRLILFDAFDTLVTPRSAPHLQYAAVARQHGLRVSDNDVKSAFKHAFRATSVEHPNYGLDTDIATPDQWWELVIQRTFAPHLHSEVTREQYDSSIASLSQRLVTRFGTDEAYDLFEDVVPTLKKLAQIRSDDNGPVSMALATNSDSHILSVLKSFGLDRFLQLDVTPSLTTGPTLSYFEKCAKPDRHFFRAAVRRNQGTGMKLETANVLYVGDQLYEDFWGATDAGLQAAWLQRPSTLESNQPYQEMSATRNSEQEQSYVSQRTIRDLSDLVDIVTHCHA
ncbi:HAD-like domain protein [Kalmanozyma brasiliensis GHG001]|uniref:HAD-like domain protein n=1 Tax=Kalmanozyma brasiliensis (strain GHG001) TaxID=1365824 RepID=UPI002867E397|nr:HAD-like domain protein [Kalmanozyma brasiliensis GHG001]KAF6767148.1 HAD-like domain protein [Kalmanozyma brasiliensis GHG001]